MYIYVNITNHVHIIINVINTKCLAQRLVPEKRYVIPVVVTVHLSRAGHLWGKQAEHRVLVQTAGGGVGAEGSNTWVRIQFTV